MTWPSMMPSLAAPTNSRRDASVPSLTLCKGAAGRKDPFNAEGPRKDENSSWSKSDRGTLSLRIPEQQRHRQGQRAGQSERSRPTQVKGGRSCAKLSPRNAAVSEGRRAPTPRPKARSQAGVESVPGARLRSHDPQGIGGDARRRSWASPIHRSRRPNNVMSFGLAAMTNSSCPSDGSASCSSFSVCSWKLA